MATRTTSAAVEFIEPGTYSSHLNPVLCRAESRSMTKRQRIVKEIFDTEHNYISQLNTIVSLFLRPIRVGCILPVEATNTIFSNIEAILSVNQELFNAMRNTTLGEAFSCLSPYLKLYSTYAKNFEKANATVYHCLRENQEFASFVEAQHAKPECHSLSLPALLITPVQRIPRYKLLLEDLIKHTKQTHPDYSKLEAATLKVEAVASYINEHIRDQDNSRKMVSIQNSLTGENAPDILAPGRKFILEGRLMKVCKRRPKERMVFLFSDALIYARPNFFDVMNTYEYRGTIPLLNCTVQVVSEEDPRVPQDIKALLKLTTQDRSLLFFSPKEDEEVYTWANELEEAIRGQHAAYESLLHLTGNFGAAEPRSLHSQVPQTPMTGDSVFVSGQWPQSSSAHAQGSGRPGVRSKRSRKLPVSGTVDEHFLEDGKEEVIEVPDEEKLLSDQRARKRDAISPSESVDNGCLKSVCCSIQ